MIISESEERFQTAETDLRLLAGTEKELVLVSALGQEPRRCPFAQNDNGLESAVKVQRVYSANRIKNY